MLCSGKIGQMCHVVCRVDGKDVFVPEHLVRRAQNKKQQDDMTSASEWYVFVLECSSSTLKHKTSQTTGTICSANETT